MQDQALYRLRKVYNIFQAANVSQDANLVSIELLRSGSSIPGDDWIDGMLSWLNTFRSLPPRLSRSGLEGTLRVFSDWWLVEGSSILVRASAKCAVFKLLTENAGNAAFVSVYESVGKIFQFQKDPSLLGAMIKAELVSEKRFTEAIEWYRILHVEPPFRDLVVPLLFTYQVSLLEKIMKESRRITVGVLVLMDRLFPVDTNEKVIQARTFGYRGELSMEWYNTRTIKNRIRAWILKFKFNDIVEEICPNLFLSNRKADVLYKFGLFLNGKLSTENFRSLVYSDVMAEEGFLLEFIAELVNANEREEAAFWVRQGQIPSSKLPSFLCEYLEQNPSALAPQSGDEKYRFADGSNLEAETPPLGPSDIQEVEYYQSSVEIVDLCESLEEFPVVAVDMEWKPCHSALPKVGLIQIAATPQKAFLIDALWVQNNMPHLMETILAALKHAIVIGFDLKSDFLNLHNTFPDVPKSATHKLRVLDLAQLFQGQLRKHATEFLPHFSEIKEQRKWNLEALAKAVLGEDLEKGDQFSNWNQRPLSASQVKYAARDVTVLVEIYERLNYRATFFPSLPFKKWKQDAIASHSSPATSTDLPPSGVPNPAPSPPAMGKLVPPPIRVAPRPPPPVVAKWRPPGRFPDWPIPGAHGPVPAANFKVVTDTMLQGLCKKLLTYGVDAKTLVNGDEHEECARLCYSEGRVVLTQGSAYTLLKTIVPDSLCVNVPAMKTDLQIDFIFKRFRVESDYEPEIKSPSRARFTVGWEEGGSEEEDEVDALLDVYGMSSDEDGEASVSGGFRLI